LFGRLQSNVSGRVVSIVSSELKDIAGEVENLGRLLSRRELGELVFELMDEIRVLEAIQEIMFEAFERLGSPAALREQGWDPTTS
jgi:hypothetical protein